MIQDLGLRRFEAIISALLHEEDTIRRLSPKGEDFGSVVPEEAKGLLKTMKDLYTKCRPPQKDLCLSYRDAVAEVRRNNNIKIEDKDILFGLIGAFIIANLRELESIRHRLDSFTFKGKLESLRGGNNALCQEMSEGEIRDNFVRCAGALIRRHSSFGQD